MKILFNGYSELVKGSKKGLFGGPRIFTQQLVKYFLDHKIEFVGLIPQSTQALDDIYETIETKTKGGKWIQVKTAFHIRDILDSKSVNVSKYTNRAIEILSEIIKEQKPNVVLLNGFSMLNWYILRAAHKARVPVVVSHHGLWFKEISEFSTSVSGVAKRITNEMEKDVKRFASHQFFLNEFSQKEFEAEFGKINANRRSILPITVNPIYLQKGRTKRKPGPLRVGFVGRWSVIKKPEVFLNIAEAAKKKGLNWKFFGVTKIFPVKELENIKTKFKKHIKVITNLQAKELKKFYADMDILILPSRFDVSPTVVAEAALQERGTIISKNVGWITEYEKQGMDNWIDSFEDVQQTLERIKELTTRPFPKKFVEYIKREHDTKKVMNAQLRILKKVSGK